MEAEQFLDKNGEPIEGTQVNDDGTVTLILEKPVKVMGTEQPVLVFTKPTTGVLMRLDHVKGETKQAIALIAAAANVPSTVIEDKSFDIADFTAASRIVGGFTRKSLKPAP